MMLNIKLYWIKVEAIPYHLKKNIWILNRGCQYSWWWYSNYWENENIKHLVLCPFESN